MLNITKDAQVWHRLHTCEIQNQRWGIRSSDSDASINIRHNDNIWLQYSSKEFHSQLYEEVLALAASNPEIARCSQSKSLSFSFLLFPSSYNDIILCIPCHAHHLTFIIAWYHHHISPGRSQSASPSRAQSSLASGFQEECAVQGDHHHSSQNIIRHGTSLTLNKSKDPG